MRSDTDNGRLPVVDTASDTVVSTVKVGEQPCASWSAPDDTVYVANRGSRSVSVIHRGDWKEAGRIATGRRPDRAWRSTARRSTS